MVSYKRSNSQQEFAHNFRSVFEKDRDWKDQDSKVRCNVWPRAGSSGQTQNQRYKCVGGGLRVLVSRRPPNKLDTILQSNYTMTMILEVETTK